MIGIDIQQVKIKDATKLLDKIALDTEKDYIHKFKCDFDMRVASLWAVKEATFKALDIAPEEISYLDIELCNKQSGKPYLIFHGKAEKFVKGKKVDISLSHQKDVVVAVVIVL